MPEPRFLRDVSGPGKRIPERQAERRQGRMLAEKSRGRNLQRLLPAAAVLLVILAVHLFLERGPDHVVEIRPVDGMLRSCFVDTTAGICFSS